MQPASMPLEQHKSNRKSAKLGKRLPRIGKVLFNENTSPVQCTVKHLEANSATLVMTGWMGLPSNFVLYVEPDSIRANCRVLNRKGSKIDVELLDVTNESRYSATL